MELGTRHDELGRIRFSLHGYLDCLAYCRNFPRHLALAENKQKIASWWPAKWQEEKRGGIDRIIQRLDGTEIPLQIKSSRTGVECALKNHPQIPCLQVKRDDTPFWVAGRILKIINR